MPMYEYVAVNPNGKQSKGSLDAENVRAARQRLRSQGIFPTEIREGSHTRATTKDVKQFFQAKRISRQDLAVATRQLSTLVGAGLPLVSALSALSEQTDSLLLKRIVVDVKEKVEEGTSLAKALGNYPKSFPRLYVNMVASGEISGMLDSVLENLADYLEEQIELRRKVSSALFYPILMFCFCVLVVIALLALVVPNIVEIFQKQGAVLPLPTRMLKGTSEFFIHFWWLLLALAVGSVVGTQRYYSTPPGRSRIDKLVLKLPLVGPLYQKICTSRVSTTLSTLLASGVGLLNALDIVRNIVGNVHIAAALEDAREGVREGRSLARELAKSGHFPSMLSHMVAVGEKSGRLEGMLAKAGQAYTREVNASLAGLISLIEPIMIIGLGGIVFTIVISVLMPMVDLINIVQK